MINRARGRDNVLGLVAGVANLPSLRLNRSFVPIFTLKRSPGTFLDARDQRRGTALSKRRPCRLFRSDTSSSGGREGKEKKNHIFLIYCSAKFRLAARPPGRAGFSARQKRTSRARAASGKIPDIFFVRE